MEKVKNLAGENNTSAVRFEKCFKKRPRQARFESGSPSAHARQLRQARFEGEASVDPTRLGLRPKPVPAG